MVDKIARELVYAGAEIASILAGSWRNQLPPLASLSGDVSDLARKLLGSGAGSLAWRRQLTSQFAPPDIAFELQQAYRLSSLEALIHQRHVQDTFLALRARGVEPLLFKGWAMARLYPEPALRPYGDIDLWLRPTQMPEATDVLFERRDKSYAVELHDSFYPVYQRDLEEVFESSQLVAIGNENVRIPCAEDHLRYLCLHFLNHGAWRPLWLCDIALFVESLPHGFSWDRVLSGRRRYRHWILCTIKLANVLLEAVVDETPASTVTLPKWFAPAVLKQWGTGSAMSQQLPLNTALRGSNPALIRSLQSHWRNPIQATIETHGSFGHAPRSPFQIAAALLQLPRIVKKNLRQRRRAQSTD